ncbi:MAG: UDP-3-O-(3-hydroxymyristoyl)glucosamine N-acyltransferase [Phycisphaerae bacterium]
MGTESSISAGELARRLGSTLVGDGSRIVRGVATLEHAGENAISWVGVKEDMSRLPTSKAGVVLMPADCATPAERTIIRVPDPDAAICQVAEWFAAPVDRVPEGVHAMATVAPDAAVTGAAIGAHAFVGPRSIIGRGTQIHPGVYIGSDTTIGEDCVLWPNVVVRERVTIGNRVVIHPNATLGADGFGYLQRDGHHRKIPQIGRVVIEDDVEIGANCAIDRARMGETRIRRGTKMDNMVQVGHNVDIGEDCVIVAQCALGGSSSLGHHVVMGGHVGIGDHVRVGSHARIAAKSVLLKNIPDGAAVRGIPAVAYHDFMRQQASVRRLPDWAEQLRSLRRRIESLEARLNRPPGD